MNRLALVLDGDAIEPGAFVEAFQHFLALLKSVDESDAPRWTVRWRLSRLSYASPLVAEVSGRPARRDVAAQRPEHLAALVLEGMQILDTGSPHPKFSDAALEDARALAESKDHGGITGVAVIGRNEAGPQTERRVPVSKRVSAAVDQVLGAKYRGLGSITGSLEAINIHDVAFFNLYEAVHGKRVRCLFSLGKMTERAKDALGKRVVVMGEVASTARGHPFSIRVSDLRILGDASELPRDLPIDPDFTDGLESAEWLRRRWNGE